MSNVSFADKSPLVSVIIPLQEGQGIFKQALFSVLEQSYSNIEVVIVDARLDVSRDNTLENCLEAYKNNPQSIVRPIQIIKKAGASIPLSINEGVSSANGAFLTILPARDHYHPERIDKLVQLLTQSKGQLAFSYVTAIDEKDARLAFDDRWRKWYENVKFEVRALAPTVGFQLLKDNVAVSEGNLFFSRQLYDEIGGFRDSASEYDHEFLLRALVLTEPVLLREELYFHRPVEGVESKANAENRLLDAYREYLLSVSGRPPKNSSAPCHWYWPSEFPKARLDLNMDRGLAFFIMQLAPTTEPQIDLKPSLPNVPIQGSAQNGKSICLISHDLSLTGAPKLVADLAFCLKKHGYNPSVVSLRDGPMGDDLRKHQIPVQFLIERTQIKVPYIKRVLGVLWLLLIKSKRVTLVNSAVSWPYVLPLALLSPFRSVIWYIHDSYFPSNLSKGQLASRLFQWVTKRNKISNIWYGSKSTRDTWRNYNVGGETMYWSGIPATVHLKKPQKLLKRLLSVGTACSRKGTYYLIEAFLNGLKEGRIAEDVTLTIVGFPDMKKNQIAFLGDVILRVMNSGYQDRIKLVGSVEPDQLDVFYQEADLFIQSSLLECLPISLLKAMSCGLPIITTDVDGCPEAIQHDQTGYICQAYSSNLLGDAIVEALNNPTHSLELGKCAQEKFNAEFSLEATEKKILDKVEGLFAKSQ